jgi:hypothetical protein
MLNDTQDVLLVLLTLASALAFMAFLNRIWKPDSRRLHNDLIGWQFSVLGTTYAVILGFMLYTVWINFGAADLNADAEANALVNINRLAEGLPDPQRTQMQTLTHSYAAVVIDREWPQMAADQIPDETRRINAAMWKTLMTLKATLPAEATAEDHSLYELSALTEHRRTRFLQSARRLPGVLWFVLIIGGLVTVASSCAFGSLNSSLHGAQVFAFSLLISLVLIAIADIDRPFEGRVHVSTYSFVRAQLNMDPSMDLRQAPHP